MSESQRVSFSSGLQRSSVVWVDFAVLKVKFWQVGLLGRGFASRSKGLFSLSPKNPKLPLMLPLTCGFIFLPDPGAQHQAEGL